MNEGIREHFPNFVANLDRGLGQPIEFVLPPASVEEITELERKLGVVLPVSYKAFLSYTRGFWAKGGRVQLDSAHPFFHDFPSFDWLPEIQKDIIRQRGSQWPPPKGCSALPNFL